MLSAMVLAGLVAAPLATVALFVHVPLRGRGKGLWPWLRRLFLALAGIHMTIIHLSRVIGLSSKIVPTLRLNCCLQG